MREILVSIIISIFLLFIIFVRRFTQTNMPRRRYKFKFLLIFKKKKNNQILFNFVFIHTLTQTTTRTIKNVACLGSSQASRRN